MVRFETLNELCLMVTANAGDCIFTKAGAFIGGESYGGKNYSFTKVMLGPQQSFGQALIGHIARRVTGENLPLMKVDFQGQSVTYYANNQQHVVVCQLAHGEVMSVESENILAFTQDCKYDIRFMEQGVISQKGIATSTLTGQGNNAFVAVLTDGNPIVLSNMQNSSTITADPDAAVCWIGADPSIKTDLNWRNLIGQSSGESYMFEWNGNQPVSVIIQPMERISGLDVSMDGRSTGSRPSSQRRNY
ncbi:MAG: AIM24 family protein [Ruminococcus sp.]|nr:AIM24 family protein [Ruminococcus sp.]